MKRRRRSHVGNLLSLSLRGGVPLNEVVLRQALERDAREHPTEADVRRIVREELAKRDEA
jgi:hypothetical protein